MGVLPERLFRFAKREPVVACAAFLSGLLLLLFAVGYASGYIVFFRW